MDLDNETFIVHMAIQERKEMAMDPDKKTQIEAQSGVQSGAHIQKKAQVGALFFDKAHTEVPAEYSDYSNVYLAENAAELPENIGMNEHAIKLEEDKQPLFGPIYSLSPVKLETLKTYIKTNLANGFIWLATFPAGAPILFNWKPDKSPHLCVDYWGLNNITIKNQYLLLLIDKSLDWLGWAKRFTQLDLTNAYHWMRIHKGDEWKTAFRIQYSHIEYQVMLLAFLMLRVPFKDMLTRFWLKSWIFSLLYTWMTY